jgi:23S rRNA pseudouridine2605 synthase
MERLQKVLAASGVASRRKAEQLILDGRVRVNGELVSVLGVKVDPSIDRITVDGRPVEMEKKVYCLLYKPSGVITTVSDPQGRKTVIDLLNNIRERVFPVGRLDSDTSGVLLLTNDGELAHALLHPRHQIEKVYRAVVEGAVTRETVRQLATGVVLEDGITFPAKVRVVSRGKNQTVLELSIHEGRNRQVRRMCAAVGHPVIRLERIRFAGLTVEGLRPGQWRRLDEKEVARLWKQVAPGRRASGRY